MSDSYPDAVVILSIDRTHDLMHTTTWGRSAEDKVFAARWGEVLAQASGTDLTQSQMFEDFRTQEKAALNAASADRKRTLLAEILAYHDGCADASPRKLPQHLVDRLRAEAGDK